MILWNFRHHQDIFRGPWKSLISSCKPLGHWVISEQKSYAFDLEKIGRYKLLQEKLRCWQNDNFEHALVFHHLASSKFELISVHCVVSFYFYNESTVTKMYLQYIQQNIINMCHYNWRAQSIPKIRQAKPEKLKKGLKFDIGRFCSEPFNC